MSVSDIGEYSGYRALWASVLLQAIKDIDSSIEAFAAKWWMYESPDKGAGSFHWICNVLELDEHLMATRCLTRQGRRTILGAQYAGLHEYNDSKEKGVAWLNPRKPTKKDKRIRRKTSRSHKKS